MVLYLRLFSTALCLLVLYTFSRAQDATHVYVERIEISGNKKTKDAYILRELGIRLNDSIAIDELPEQLALGRSYLQNTGLFNDIEVNIRDWDKVSNKILISVQVSESWYIYPIPILSLADRSFNVWWTTHNRDINRLNFGINFIWVNFSGVNDKVKIYLNGGYRRRIRLQYDRPYINRKKTIGFSARYQFTHQREFQYETRFNRQQFYTDEEQIIFRSRRFILALSYKPGQRSSHSFLMKHDQTSIDPSASDLNPSFFNSGDRQRFFELAYGFVNEGRDNKFYALKGYYFGVAATKTGLGIVNDINRFNTESIYARFFPLSDKLNLEMRLKARKEWINEDHPYHGLTALGYGESFIRGYELYIIDGTDYFLSQNSLRLRVFRKVFNWGKIIPVESYRKFPVDVYFTLNGDTGYVKNERFGDANSLTNRWVFGGGIGLDIVLYTKYAFQIEFSRNHWNENGIYLNARTRL